MYHAAVKIQSRLPDCHHFGICCQFLNLMDVRLLRVVYFMGMDSDGRENLRVFFSQYNCLFARFYTRARGDYPAHSGFLGPRHHRLKIFSKFFPVQMSMSINDIYFGIIQY